MKKTANTENAAIVMPRPVGMYAPEKDTLSVADGDFSLSLVLPWAFEDGTLNECRKRFKLIAQFGTDADKALIDAWFAYEMNLCAIAYWEIASVSYANSVSAGIAKRQTRQYEKLTKRRALWEQVWNAVNWAEIEAQAAAVETQAAEPEAESVETQPVSEPETSHDEPKTEQAARPEGRKPMNANFNFFAGCENADAARKRYYQLSKVYHPDTGIGDTETMAVITNQYQAFMGRSSVASDIPELPAGVIALPEHCETPATVDEAAEYADAIAAILKLHIPGVSAEIIGSFIWLSGLNAEMKDAHAALKAAGYRFSGGKKMWYWAPSSERGQKKRYRGAASMGYIRTKYGSRKIDLDGLSA